MSIRIAVGARAVPCATIELRRDRNGRALPFRAATVRERSATGRRTATFNGAFAARAARTLSVPQAPYQFSTSQSADEGAS